MPIGGVHPALSCLVPIVAVLPNRSTLRMAASELRVKTQILVELLASFYRARPNCMHDFYNFILSVQYNLNNVN